jgi:hypothetical protein
MARSYRNPDRAVVKVSSKETRVVRRSRRRAEKAELTGARVGKQAQRATRNGWWYA